MLLAVPYAATYASDARVAVAGVPADSVKKSKNATGKGHYAAGYKGYNALKYSMQKRHRYPDRVKFSNTSILSHLYTGVLLSYDQIAKQKDLEFSSAVSYGLLVGKDISKTHSLSLQFLYGNTPLKRVKREQNAELTKMSAQLNHHFNFTRYYLGHDAYRIYEIASTLGVGYQSLELFNKKDNSSYFLVGLRNSFRIGPDAILLIEPHVAYASKSYDVSKIDYTSNKYNVSYGVSTALLYEFRNELTGVERAKDEYLFPRNYFFTGGGLQYLDTDVLLVDGVGPNFVFGYGRWIARHFAMQFSAGYTSGIWRNKEILPDIKKNIAGNTAYARSQQAYARAELLYNIYTTVKSRNAIKNDLSVNIFGGYEYGMLWKYYPTVNNQENCYYGGFTSGVNLKYHIDNSTALFFEPRITFISYNTPYNAPYDYVKVAEKYRRYSIAMGMELAADKQTVKTSKAEDGFTPEYSFSLFGGANYLFERTGYYGDNTGDYSFGLLIDHQPHRLYGYRVMADYSKYNLANVLNYNYTTGDKTTSRTGRWDYSYNILSVGLNLKFDITNAFFGHNASRRWRSALYVGPLASKVIGMDKSLAPHEPLPGDRVAKTNKKYNDEINLGVYAGINYRYYMNRAWSVFAEGGMRVYKNEFIPRESLDYNPVKMMNFMAGVSYNHQSDINAIKSRYLFPRNYLFQGVGLQYVNSDVEFLDGLGPQLSLGYGRWLCRRLALQMSMNYASSNSSKKKQPANIKEGHPAYMGYGKTQSLALRGEVVYNFLTTIKDRNAIKNDFSLNAILGYEIGARWDYAALKDENMSGSYTGVTGALNFKYHIDDSYALFIEPRTTISKYSKKYNKENGEVSYNHSLMAGIELPFDRGNFKFYKKEQNVFVPEYTFSVFAGVNHLFRKKSNEGYDDYDTNLGVAIGYQPHPLFGYRMMFNYAKYNFNDISQYTERLNGKTYSYQGLWNYKYHLLTLGADIKFDVTNALYGYTPNRKWKSSLYVGPVAAQIVKLESKIAPNVLTFEGSTVTLNKKYNSKLQIGLHAAYNASYTFYKGFDIFAEVGLKMFKDAMMPGEDLHYKPIKMMDFNLGMNYRLKEKTGVAKEGDFFRRNYIFNGVGIQYTNTDVPLVDGVGPQFAFGYGRWLSKRTAIQVALGYSAGNGQQKLVRATKTNPKYLAFGNMQYAFMRSEIVNNVYTTINDRNAVNNDFSVNVLAGIELGHRWKYHSLGGQVDKGYTAPTIGVNLKYHPNSNYALFVEPRFAYIEGLSRYNINVGVEYSMDKETLANRNHSTKYEPQVAVALNGGVNYIVKRTGYNGKSNANTSFGASIEYQPYKLFGVRALFDYSTIGFNHIYKYTQNVDGVTNEKKGLWNKTYHIASLGIDGKFDVTNALYGYNPDRKWNSAIYLGPVISTIVKLDSKISADEKFEGKASIKKRYKDGANIGLHAAFNTSYNITPLFGIFGEVGIRAYKNTFILAEDLDYNPIKILNFNLGVSYRMKNSGQGSKENEAPYNSYFFSGAGLQYTNTDVPLIDGVGPQVAFGYGRWLSNRVALQVALGYSAGNSHQRYISATKTHPKYIAYGNTQYLFMRGELVTNLFSTISDKGAASNDFSVNLATGLELGSRWKYVAASQSQNDGSYVAPTVGINLKYHPNESYALFVEPRAAFIKGLARYNVNVGIECAMDKDVYKKGGSDEFEPQYSLSVMGGTNYLIKRTSYKGKKNANTSFGIAAEYQPVKSFGVRALFDYSSYGFNDVCRYTERTDGALRNDRGLWNYSYKMLSLTVDAKYDLTNAIKGYDADRRWRNALYVGPVFTKITKLDAEISSAEKIEGGSLAIGKRYDDGLHIGLHAAYNTTYSLTPSLNLFGEVGVKLYKNELFMSESLDYNPVKALSFQLGISYNIK